ncbi:MAG: RNA-binding cell elongation regulator Jag/EloR [Anaerolineae bacterium]
MSLGPDFIETTGETVEEAISKGLSELGVSPAQVMIEVLEEPGGGLFGSDKRPARVRLQLIGGRPAMPPPAPPPVEVRETPREPRREREAQKPRERSSDKGENTTPQSASNAGHTETGRPERTEKPKRANRPERGAKPERGQRPERSGDRARIAQPVAEDEGEAAVSLGGLEKKPYFDLDVDDKDENLPLVYTPDEVPESEQDDEAQVSKVVLNELLERMSIRAQVVVRRASPGEQGGKSPWVLDVNAGRTLSRLIGRRGETLAALQYVTRLIASRELQRRVDIVVDVESYKVKRAATLHSLALRMADEAIHAGRTITLEPMPPHERRIIHLALRGREDVVTKSVGEGQSRKVTIVPQSELS